jgi:hypothetical protein
MVKIGQTAMASELKARWAYAEMQSTRFRRHFEEAGYGDLLAKATARVPFCKLPPDEQQRLAPALLAVRNEGFANNIDGSGDTYECKAWTEDDLTRSWALPAFNPPAKAHCVPYRDFYNGEPNTGPGGTAEDSDPRVAVQKLEPQAQYQQTEPVIVVGQPGNYILLDGYLRSLLFMKSPDKTKRLLAWVPVAK